MINKKLTALVALATCAFTLSALGSGKRVNGTLKLPVTVAITMQAHGTIIVSPTNNQWEWEDFGESDVLGRYKSFGGGTIPKANVSRRLKQPGPPVVGPGHSDLPAAGSLVTVTAQGYLFMRFPGQNGYDVEITGGTGLYQGASGGLHHVSMTMDEPSMHRGGSIEVWSVTYVNSGEITYYP